MPVTDVLYSRVVPVVAPPHRQYPAVFADWDLAFAAEAVGVPTASAVPSA
jgi:hypothetical protein